MEKNKLLYAAAMGDALGVPHEFKTPEQINQDFITNPLRITKKYRSHEWSELGTYSDDFSQILCVENCLNNPSLDFNDELLEWACGKYWVNEIQYDIGRQTCDALFHYDDTGDYLDSEDLSGNGGLMRMLPVALHFCEHPELNLCDLVTKYSLITHNSDESLAVSEVYCWLIFLLETAVIQEDRKLLFSRLWDIAGDTVGYKFPEYREISGTGYCVDTMLILKTCVEASHSFTEAIRMCISYGGDTDTNASVAAPVFALVFDMDDVPDEWHQYMKVNEQNQYYLEATK